MKKNSRKKMALTKKKNLIGRIKERRRLEMKFLNSTIEQSHLMKVLLRHSKYTAILINCDIEMLEVSSLHSFQEKSHLKQQLQ